MKRLLDERQTWRGLSELVSGCVCSTDSSQCIMLLICAAFGPLGSGGLAEYTEHATMAPDSSSATSSCNSSTPSSPAVGVYHISSSPSGYPPTRSADYTGHSQAFQFPGELLHLFHVLLCFCNRFVFFRDSSLVTSSCFITNSISVTLMKIQMCSRMYKKQTDSGGQLFRFSGAL